MSLKEMSNIFFLEKLTRHCIRAQRIHADLQKKEYQHSMKMVKTYPLMKINDVFIWQIMSYIIFLFDGKKKKIKKKNVFFVVAAGKFLLVH